MGHPTEQANGARASPHRPSRSISSLPLEKLSKLNCEKRTSVSAVSSPAARVGDAAENGIIMQQSIGSLIGQDGAARRKGARRGSGDSHGSGVEGGWESERKSSSFNPFRGHRRIGSGSYLTTGKTPTPASWDSSPRAKRTGASSRSAAASPRKLDKYAVAKIAASLFHSPGTKLDRSASQRASPSSSSPGKKRNHTLTVGELILPSNHRYATPRTEERVPTRPCSEQHMEESAIPPASSLPIHIVDDTEPEEAPESPSPNASTPVENPPESPPPNASTPAEDPPPRPEQRIESPVAAIEIRHDESCQNPPNADVSDRADVEVFPESPTVSTAALFGDTGEGGIEGVEGELEPSDVGDCRLGLEPSDFGESGDDGGDARAMCHVAMSVTREGEGGGEHVVEDHRVRSCGVVDCVRHSACQSTSCDLGDGWIGEKDGDGGEVPAMCHVAMSKMREGDCRGEEQAVGCSIGDLQVKSCGMIAHVRDNHVFQIESKSIVLEDLHLFKKDDDDDSSDVSMFPTAMCCVAMEVTRESDGCEDQAVEYSIGNNQDTLVATSNVSIKHDKLLNTEASCHDEELQDTPESPLEVPCVRRELPIIPMVSLSSIASPSPRLALWQEDELVTALSSGSCKKKSAVRPILRKRRRSASGSGLSALLLKSMRVLEDGSTMPHERRKGGIEVGVLESEPEDAIKSTYSKFVDIEIDPRHGCVELVQHCKDISHDNTMEELGRKGCQVASSMERQFGSNPRRFPPVKINSCTIYEGKTRTRKIKTIRRGRMNSYDLDTLKEYLKTTNSFPSLPKTDSSTNTEAAAAATAISPHNKLMESSLGPRECSRTFVARLQAPSSGAFSYVDVYHPCSVSILSNPSFSSSHQDKLWEEQAEIYSSGGRGTPGRDDDDGDKNDNDDEAPKGDATAQPLPPPPALVFNLHHSPLPGFGSALHQPHHHHEHRHRPRHPGSNPSSRQSGLRNGSLRSPPESGHFMHQIMSRIRGSSPKASAVAAAAGTTPARPGSYVTSRMEISKKRNPWSSCICFSIKT